MFKASLEKWRFLFRKYKKLIIGLMLLVFSATGLLVANYLVKREVRFTPRASEDQGVAVAPLVLPGSLLDTGIRAEDFGDVDRNSWSWKYIQQIAPLGIMPPRTPTEFDPQGLVPRVDMAEFLLKTYELLTGGTAPIVETPFEDIDHLSQEQQDTIAKIYGLKITAGTTDTTFSPEQEVNRAQMVTFLSNLYKAITGEFPAEAEVPFTDIYEADMAWAVKYIKKTYNLKITAGISETEFGPYLSTTREQMATFIFNFMRLFGPSPTDSAFAQELVEIKSVTWGDYDDIKPSTYGYRLQEALPEIKKTGFNTVWLVNAWKVLDPKPLANPPEYDEKEFAALISALELLKQNNMKAVIGLNYLAKNWAPEGIDYCSWTTNLDMYQAFEAYVNEFLTRIEAYSDMVYILLFVEGSEPCNLRLREDAKQIAAVIRPTIGSLPQRLNPELRNKFKIGLHDHILLTHNWSVGESPVQMPLTYDFYSMVFYGLEERTNQEIVGVFDASTGYVRAMLPFTPVFTGEFGVSYCNFTNQYISTQSTNENQARVLEAGVTDLLSKSIGFNIWQWQGAFNRGDCPASGLSTAPNPVVFGLAYTSDYEEYPSVIVSKPARAKLMKLLNPSAPELTCLEEQTFARNKLNNECYEFPSHCPPGGWTVWEEVDSCDEVCAQVITWARNQSTNECREFPDACLPTGWLADSSCQPTTGSSTSTSVDQPTDSQSEAVTSTEDEVSLPEVESEAIPPPVIQDSTFPVITEEAQSVVEDEQVTLAEPESYEAEQVDWLTNVIEAVKAVVDEIF